MVLENINQIYRKCLWLLKKLGSEVGKSKRLLLVILIVLFLLVPSIFAEQSAQHGPKVSKQQEILGITSVEVLPAPIITPPSIMVSTPTITLTPSPTLIPSSTPTLTPTSTPTNNSTPLPTNTPIPTSTLIPTLTPTPTPTGLNVQIGIDYANQKSSDSYSIVVNSDQTAWEAVVAAIGISNLQYTDYGGDMGIFITGFNGIAAESNQYYEFRVNGVPSNIGVSSYKCNDGDKLDFVLTTF